MVPRISWSLAEGEASVEWVASVEAAVVFKIPLGSAPAPLLTTNCVTLGKLAFSLSLSFLLCKTDDNRITSKGCLHDSIPIVR